MERREMRRPQGPGKKNFYIIVVTNGGADIKHIRREKGKRKDHKELKSKLIHATEFERLSRILKLQEFEDQRLELHGI